MPSQIIMPQLGESVVEGTVARWLKSEGEAIAEMEPLLEVSTDKVDSEIPSPASGVLLKILVPAGETVRAGTVLAWVGQPGEAIPGTEGGDGEAQRREGTSSVTATGPEKEAESATEGANGSTRPVTAGRSRDLGFISPVVARMAQEHNLDLALITGTGQGGRITKKDVEAYLANIQKQPAAQTAEAPLPWETPGEGDLFRPTEMVFQKSAGQEATRPLHQPASLTPEEQPAAPALPPGRLIPHTTMRRKIAEHMLYSVRTSPHVTTVMEADLHRVTAHYQANKRLLERDGVHLTYTAYFAAAAAQALREVPLVNSSWTEEGILIHPQVNLGIAVSLGDEGLIVPVIHNADGMSLLGLARALQDLAARARSRRLRPDEIQGGTFTITNHGISGSLLATPIIHQPQCAILGVGAVQKRVIVTSEDAIAIRPMVYLSLTFDHRILDGAAADSFLAAVVKRLEAWH